MSLASRRVPFSQEWLQLLHGRRIDDSAFSGDFGFGVEAAERLLKQWSNQRLLSWARTVAVVGTHMTEKVAAAQALRARAALFARLSDASR